MNVEQLNIDDNYRFNNVECQLSDVTKPTDDIYGQECFIENSGGLRLYTKSAVYRFRFVSGAIDVIENYMSRGFYNICKICPTHGDTGRFYLTIVFFYAKEHLGNLKILISENVKNSMIKKRIIKLEEKDTDEFYRSFADSFIFSDGMTKCYAFSDGFYRSLDGDKSEQDSEDTDDNSDDENENETFEAASTEKVSRFKAIKLYGKNCTLFVSLSNSESSGSILVAKKIVYRRNHHDTMKLGIGEISFTGESSYISSEVKRILSENPGYLELWDKYAKLEGEFLLKRARSIGVISFSRENMSMLHGNVSISFPEAHPELEMLTNGDMVYSGIPCYIDNPDMSWEGYISLPRKERTVSRGFKVIRSNSRMLELEGDVVPKSPLVLSITGNMKQIERRETARRRIANGICANPRLGLIFDGRSVGSFDDTRKNKRIEPLSKYVMDKVFPVNPPTDAQRKAIDIALNTPDIAIIQGPPGTGKTTVIKAIIERLNEITDKKERSVGEILVTSMQHDAVYNVINGMRINDMPAIKIGSHSNGDGDDAAEWNNSIKEWCRQISNSVLEKNPQLQQTLECGEIKQLYQFYLMYPSDSRAVELLRECAMICRSNELAQRVESLIQKLSVDSVSGADELVVMIRRLRVTAVGFADDGADNALALWDTLSQDELFDKNDTENSEILAVLKKAAMTEIPNKELLKRIRQIRDTLLNRIIPPPFYGKETARKDVIDTVNEVINCCSEYDGEMESVLRDLVHELNCFSSGVNEAVKSYSFVFASTAQQSEGGEIYNAKGITTHGEYPTYDTVIVDEAARIMPGDLMIPLSQARKRIILVGDHRQLPHVYDEEIFEQLKAEGDRINEEDITESMFRHLMLSARELEKQDGIPRCVTLDRQYRTHPLLGNFVNSCFYEPNGEGFGSPLAADKFSQPIYDSPLVWVNIPTSHGVEEKRGTSRARKSEADYIVSKLKEYLKRDDCKKLTFGVITFYNAQKELIQKSLNGLSEDERARVRVGSVDAFQGMEFDVVFLSVVRTASRAAKIDDMNEFNADVSKLPENDSAVHRHKDYLNSLGMKYYGFLVSENRLCVAISRQKRLLIIVGDRDVFWRKDYARIAQKCVPTMYKLYSLAEKEGVVLDV